MAGTLYIVATPIGNLDDMPPRVAATFGAADFIAAEDTRVTMKLLNFLGLKKPMVSYYEHALQKGEAILQRIEAGESCALCSDAGMPCVSDPGEVIVRDALARGIKVVPVPAASACVTALAVSGQDTSRWVFEGFLPVNRKQKKERLADLLHEKRTVIFYEAPHKLRTTLDDLTAAFGPERSMSRSEAAAIFARLLSDRLDERIPSGNNVKFKDIDPDMWYAGYVEYLTGYGVAVGYNDRTYRGDKAITRAEFTAMAARFFDVYGDGAEEIMEQYEGFDDVSDGYWAAEYIKAAAKHGWITGYGDGSFRADRQITRAEVMTIVNRLLGRAADLEYVSDNLRKLNTFPDVSRRYWAYSDILEAANAHNAILGTEESWYK